jgi:hypothetical protein
MTVKEIFQRAQSSVLHSDPYVKRIWGLVHEDLFSLPPDSLARLRKELIGECLRFFQRRSPYYADLIERTGVDLQNPDLTDLARLAVPSDMLRGDGHKRFLIPGVEEEGETFSSSGTTGRAPVRIYRSPLDLAIMVWANTALFEHVYGGELEPGKGVALFMAAPELRYRLSFVAFVALTLESKGIDLLYGMDLEEGRDGDKPWTKLTPNTANIIKFLKSKAEPKLFFTAPAGVHLLTKRMEELSWGKRLVQRIATGTPPVRLGKGGMIVTGCGTKGYDDLPPYETIVENARRQFTAQDRDGAAVTTPFMDVLGMTETLTALIDREGTTAKVPHPLSTVFLLDPVTLEPMEEGAREGLVCLFNPFVTSWLECFYPGDLMSSRTSTSFYGKEFIFQRRLTVREGWSLQRACGGSMEEMMTGGQR